MKVVFFVLGLAIGISATLLWEVYEAIQVPFESGAIAASCLRQNLEQIEACPSRQEAIAQAYRSVTQSSDKVPWGEALPPVIQGDEVMLRIRRPQLDNVYLVLEGTAKLPQETSGH